LLDAAGLGAIADDQPGAVDRLPDLDGERGARRPCIVARLGEAGADRAGVGLRKGEVAADIGGIVRFARGAEGAGGADHGEGAPPGLLALLMVAERGEPDRRLDQARGEFGPLHIAADPVEMGGGAREHQPAPPSPGASTKLSLVPPPWLEFTTSEPS